MYKGDISNAFTRRVLVTTDAVLTWESSKFLVLSPRLKKNTRSILKSLAAYTCGLLAVNIPMS